LATVVVVVQTSLKGGAMHTARDAFEQGRPLYCPPASGNGPEDAGTTALLEVPASRIGRVARAWETAPKIRSDAGHSRPPAVRLDDSTLAALVGGSMRPEDGVGSAPLRLFPM
jgi:predicted Rossmann fold nucleotide-binding protein DprA/Smf involved in DNA uptake